MWLLYCVCETAAGVLTWLSAAAGAGLGIRTPVECRDRGMHCRKPPEKYYKLYKILHIDLNERTQFYFGSTRWQQRISNKLQLAVERKTFRKAPEKHHKLDRILHKISLMFFLTQQLHHCNQWQLPRKCNVWVSSIIHETWSKVWQTCQLWAWKIYTEWNVFMLLTPVISKWMVIEIHWGSLKRNNLFDAGVTISFQNVRSNTHMS